MILFESGRLKNVFRRPDVLWIKNTDDLKPFNFIIGLMKFQILA